jgi:hypothetical protein
MNKKRITDFLKVYTLILILIFFIILMVNVLILKINPSKSCYEVMDMGNSVVYDNITYYQNSTSCQVVTSSEAEGMKLSMRRSGILASVCLFSIIIIGVFEKIKSGAWKK